MNKKEKKKAVVIGAGIGGIASAIRLAVKGFQVDVFEANAYPGGKLSEFVEGGFRFDAGPSLFTMPQLVDELFELAGEDPRTHFNYLRLEEICAYFYPDGTRLTARADLEAFASDAARSTGVDSRRVLRQLKRSRYIYRVTGTLFLQRSLHRISSYLSFSTLWSFIQLPFLNIFTTMNRANSKLLKNPKMVQLFNRYATYNGSDPYQAPGVLNIIPHLEYNLGAYFPKGGMHQITLSLVGLAERLGVRFNYNARVEEILVKKGRATGIRVQGANQDSAIVVCNMDVVPAYRQLLKGQKQPEKVLRQQRSSSALIFYWGIEQVFEELKVHNIFFSEDYRQEFLHIFKHKNIFSDPTVYIHISSKVEPGDAPKGMENWFVMINVPADHGQDWETLIAEAREAILHKLSDMLGTNIRELIRTEELLDPRTIASRTRSFQGALYGTSSNNRMAAFFRHPNFSRRIRALYFCGGSVHPGGGIPLALSSAKIVDSLIKA